MIHLNREVYEEYCEGMKELGLRLMELMGISLGVGREHYKEFFEDGECIMRCNYYPPCNQPGLTLGTGPHCDPTSLTILHQDNVGGLDVFAHNKWLRVPPRPHAFVINVGDTFSVIFSSFLSSYTQPLIQALVHSRKRK